MATAALSPISLSQQEATVEISLVSLPQNDLVTADSPISLPRQETQELQQVFDVGVGAEAPPELQPISSPDRKSVV